MNNSWWKGHDNSSFKLSCNYIDKVMSCDSPFACERDFV